MGGPAVAGLPNKILFNALVALSSSLLHSSCQCIELVRIFVISVRERFALWTHVRARSMTGCTKPRLGS